MIVVRLVRPPFVGSVIRQQAGAVIRIDLMIDSGGCVYTELARLTGIAMGSTDGSDHTDK